MHSFVSQKRKKYGAILPSCPDSRPPRAMRFWGTGSVAQAVSQSLNDRKAYSKPSSNLLQCNTFLMHCYRPSSIKISVSLSWGHGLCKHKIVALNIYYTTQTVWIVLSKEDSFTCNTLFFGAKPTLRFGKHKKYSSFFDFVASGAARGVTLKLFFKSSMPVWYCLRNARSESAFIVRYFFQDQDYKNVSQKLRWPLTFFE